MKKNKVILTYEEQRHFVELSKLLMRIESGIKKEKAIKKSIKELTKCLKVILLRKFGIRYRKNMVHI